MPRSTFRFDHGFHTIGASAIALTLLVAMCGPLMPVANGYSSGPVLALFSSTDCTGPYEVMESDVQMNTCQDGDIVKEADGTVIQWQGNDFRNCDYSRENSSFIATTYYYGVCSTAWYTGGGDRRDSTGTDAIIHSQFSKLMGAQKVQELAQWMGERRGQAKREGRQEQDEQASIMWMPNRYYSFESPQPGFVDKDIPSYSEADQHVPCNGVNDCTLPDGTVAPYWRTYFDYHETSCPLDSNRTSSVMFPNLNFNQGNCYNYAHQSYVSASCADSHTYTTAYFTRSDCSESPTVVLSQRLVCGTGDVSGTIHCSASPVRYQPFGAPVPVSFPEYEPTPYADGSLAASLSSLAIIVASISLFLY